MDFTPAVFGTFDGIADGSGGCVTLFVYVGKFGVGAGLFNVDADGYAAYYVGGFEGLWHCVSAEGEVETVLSYEVGYFVDFGDDGAFVKP